MILLKSPQGSDLSLKNAYGRVVLCKLLFKTWLDVLLALHPLEGVIKLLFLYLENWVYLRLAIWYALSA